MSEKRKQTAQQKLNNFLRSDEAKTYPLCQAKIAILHALASFFYYNSECNPSLAAICEYTFIKKTKTVSDHLHDLEALNLIPKEKINGERNKYFWNIPEVSDEQIYQKKPVDKNEKRCK